MVDQMQRKVLIIFTGLILTYTWTHLPRINKLFCYISLWYGIISKFIPEASSQTSPTPYDWREMTQEGADENSRLGREMPLCAHLGHLHLLIPQFTPGKVPDQIAWAGYFPKWWNPSCTMFHTSALNTGLFVCFSEDPTSHSSYSSCLWVNRGCSDNVCIGLILLCFGNLPGFGEHLQFSVS